MKTRGEPPQRAKVLRPVTAAGKAAVSQNAIGHGCAAKFKVPPFEKQEEYDEFLAQLMEDEKPVGLAEIHLGAKWPSTPGSPIALSTGQGTNRHVGETLP